MFSEKRWEKWLGKELENYQLVNNPGLHSPSKRYLKKGYLHFDPRYWLPERQIKLKQFLSFSDNVEKRAFYPFVKINIRTPRFRYDEEHGYRSIEYKKRPICYASHFDALVYSFYAHCLTEIYEEYIKECEIEECVLAYRTDTNSSNIDFARDVFEYVKHFGECTAIALDVKKFFDTLSHKKLKEKWLKIIGKEKLPPDQYSIYKSLTKYAYVNKNTLLKHLGIDLKKGKKNMKVLLEPSAYNFKRLRDHNIICTNKSSIGIPQGAPISSVLSNIYMIDYDLFFQKMSEDLDFIYRRYCDDILFICKHDQADDIVKLAYDKIEECQLTIQPKKEENVIFTYGLNGKLRGFDKQRMEEENISIQALRSTEGEKYYKNLQYLGFEFNGQNVYIRSSSMSRYFQRMKKGTETVVKMAYGPNGRGKKIFKRKLFSRYTHLGKRNFITYALKAASDYYKNSKGEVKRGFNSPTIKKQVSRHFSKLKKIIEQKSKQRAENRGKSLKD